MRITSFVNEYDKKNGQKYIPSQNATFNSIWSNQTCLGLPQKGSLLAAVTHYAPTQLQ